MLEISTFEVGRQETSAEAVPSPHGIDHWHWLWLLVEDLVPMIEGGSRFALGDEDGLQVELLRQRLCRLGLVLFLNPYNLLDQGKFLVVDLEDRCMLHPLQDDFLGIEILADVHVIEDMRCLDAVQDCLQRLPAFAASLCEGAEVYDITAWGQGMDQLDMVPCAWLVERVVGALAREHDVCPSRGILAVADPVRGQPQAIDACKGSLAQFVIAYSRDNGAVPTQCMEVCAHVQWSSSNDRSVWEYVEQDLSK